MTNENVSIEAWNQTCIDFDSGDKDTGLYELIANYYLVNDDLKNRKNYVEPKKRYKP